MRRALLFAAVLVTAFLVPAGSAHAATINVTTTGDETIANGLTSLREAFIIANGNGQNDTIQLQANANYVLDACDDGPLTHTAPHSLTIQGANASLQNTCGETQTILDTDGTAGMTINNLEMSGVFVDEGETVDGAAIKFDTGGNLVLSNVEIHGFSSGLGGSIVDGGDFSTHGTIQNGSEIWGNQGVAFTLSFGSLTLTNSEIHDNTGSGISLVDGSPLVITDSSITGNTGSGATTTGQGNTIVDVTSSTISFNGGVGLSCSACDDVSVDDSDIVGNGATTTTGGGGVRATWDYDQVSDSPVLAITDSTIAFNRAVRNGGGVFVNAFSPVEEPDATAGALNITGSTIGGNLTEDALDIDGGGIYAATGNITIVDSQIDTNFAGPPGGITSAEGGGIWHRELTDLNGTRTLSITDSDVINNEANGNGGGIYAAHNGSVSITRSSLSGNTANGPSGGGGMLTSGTTTTVTTTRVLFNSAEVGGGLAHGAFSGLPVGSLTVNRSTLASNSANFGASGGGGMFVNVGGAGAQATVRNSTVTNNTSAGLGGGLLVNQTSRLFLDHATVVENTGSTGANVRVAAGTFRTRRAVIALAQGSGDNCQFFAAPQVNDGYSWADDTSCNLGGLDTEAPGVDPKLAVLANNGGPTPTRKPDPDTPLAIVPAGSCTLTVDQRNIARPQGDECEAGAVEIVEAAK